MAGQTKSKTRNTVIFTRLERAAPAIRKQFGDGKPVFSDHMREGNRLGPVMSMFSWNWPKGMPHSGSLSGKRTTPKHYSDTRWT